MPLETIYVVRHGFRTSWSVDAVTGTYSSSIPSPTGIAVDPALTAHGVDQARQLGHHLMALQPAVEAVYSSPYYRCLQTLSPFIGLQRQRQQQQQQQQQQRHSKGSQSQASTVGGADARDASPTTIQPEYGLCEWFGSAPFEHPQPASPGVLKSMFPAYDETYVSAQRPSRRGETLAQLQDRVAATMQSIVDRCDAQDRRAVVLCTHAAVVITLGRVLTGHFPEAVDADDFRAFTCGLSVYRRKGLHCSSEARGDRDPIAGGDSAGGPIGGWICTANSDCSFLSGGEERGWNFAGDEEFPGTGSMSHTAAEPRL